MLPVPVELADARTDLTNVTVAERFFDEAGARDAGPVQSFKVALHRRTRSVHQDPPAPHALLISKRGLFLCPWPSLAPGRPSAPHEWRRERPHMSGRRVGFGPLIGGSAGC